ncbi:MAG TPA: GNAT family N-acetyltransferase [Coriobacteriia bacterium]|nr:GNAT family N-acetyltransferase [Coriobacteriia bacterium]
MSVTCADHVEHPPVALEYRRASDDDRGAIETICDRAIGETIVDAFGQTHDILGAINLLAESDGSLAGILSLVVSAGELTVIFLSVYPEFQGSGVGAGLLKAADAFAAERGLTFLRVTVTNDDMPLLYFFQRHGFTIYEVAVGEVADRFGAATPGFSGIPSRDEIRMRRAVCARG